MFNALEVEKHYGSRTVLNGVSLTIGAGERVGLVGRNGCGKSTLLRILAGLDNGDRGGIAAVRRGLSTGYLPQHPDFEPDGTVMQAATAALPPGVQEWEAREALLGLGFAREQFQQRAGTLSGGEKTRLMLSRLLVAPHDLLLLDEPTSHLDVSMLGWLEARLRAYRGAYVVASHDRLFLDRTVDRIVELSDGNLRTFSGGYSVYAEAKRRAIEQHREDYTLQQRQIRALREFASRQMGWAAECQSGPKRGRDQRGRIAEKMARRAHAAERRVAQIEPMEKLRDTHHLSARLQPDRRGGAVVAEMEDASKAYGSKPLFTGVTLAIGCGERIGIVGPNGAGKTTLLRVLLGEETVDCGTVRHGAAVSPCYLAQEQEQLDPAKTVLESVEEVGRLSPTEARTLLACFLFREAEVFKRVRDLSGGERVRLAVAGAVVSGANLLVLDEPTNHLDIDTRERLEDALAGYTGTLLVVSHDRYLLDRLTSRTLSLGGGRLEDYPGPFSEWEAARVRSDPPTG